MILCNYARKPFVFQNHEHVTAVVFGSLASLAFVSVLSLPETLNKPLPQTLGAAMDKES